MEQFAYATVLQLQGLEVRTGSRSQTVNEDRGYDTILNIYVQSKVDEMASLV